MSSKALAASLRRVCARTLEASEAPRYATDWLGKIRPSPACVVCRPAAVEEVAAVLRYCSAEGVPVVPQAGNTGLVQASVPASDAPPTVVVSVDLLNAMTLRQSDSVLECGAGVVLLEAQARAAAAGLVFPLDMGSKGSAMVGGATATNAGGIHVVRYGSFRSNVLGLRAVLPDGTVVDRRSVLRKDNTGYDLKQLFIGSEGTLGVITDVNVVLHPQPASRATIRVAVKSREDIEALFSIASSTLGPCLGAFEVMDCEGLSAVGVDREGSATVLLEALSYIGGDAEAATLAALADKLGGAFPDAEFADGSRQRPMWEEREEHPVKLAKLGRIYKYDLSAARRHFFHAVDVARDTARAALGPALAESDLIITGYGHFGDGNVHLNIVDRRNRHQQFITSVLSDAIYEALASVKGSISAEHGIGREKRAAFHRTAQPESLALMRAVKCALDPQGIMNPGAML